MSDFAPQDSQVEPLFISSLGPQSAVVKVSRTGTVNPASITWVANQAVFIPVTLPFPYPVRRVFWGVGSAGGGNVDFGIYNFEGTRLFSTGSTAQSGTSTLQYVDVTDFLLTPGVYYFGYAASGTTNVSNGSTVATATFQRMAGILQQASALPLPATMASAGAATQAIYPLCGITRTASGF